MAYKEKRRNGSDANFKRMIDGQTGIILSRLNSRRAAFAAVLAVIYQLCMLLTAHDKADRLEIIGLSVTIAASALYLLCYHLFFVRPSAGSAPEKRTGSRLVNFSYQVFLIVLIIGSAPCLVADVSRFEMIPLSNLFILSLLVIIPVVTLKTSIRFFAFAVPVTIGCAVWAGGTAKYIAFISGMNIVAVALSHLLHREYIDVVARLQTVCEHDELTELQNKRSGLQVMRSTYAICQRLGQPCAVYVADIDELESYNNSFGRLKGDAVIKSVAKSLRGAFSRSSDIVCRTDGEEFAVFIAVNDYVNAKQLAQKAVRRVEDMCIASGKDDGLLTISIGAAYYDPKDDSEKKRTLLELLDDADRQLVAAKESGKARASIARAGEATKPAGAASEKFGEGSVDNVTVELKEYVSSEDPMRPTVVQDEAAAMIIIDEDADSAAVEAFSDPNETTEQVSEPAESDTTTDAVQEHGIEASCDSEDDKQENTN